MFSVYGHQIQRGPAARYVVSVDVTMYAGAGCAISSEAN